VEKNACLSRRNFLAAAAAGLAVVPLASLVSTPALAAELPHLSPDDPSAKALAYTSDSSGLTPAKDPLYKPGSHCGSCALFQAAQAGKDGWGPCAAFPGKAVNKNGWCHAWAAAA